MATNKVFSNTANSLEEPLPELGKAVGKSKCNQCEQCKPYTEFYRKRNGYEAFCKDCKRQNRKANSELVNSKRKSLKTVNVSARAQIENEGVCTPNIEPATELNFEVWERRYNRALTDAEKEEIKFNLKEFVMLLVAEE